MRHALKSRSSVRFSPALGRLQLSSADGSDIVDTFQDPILPLRKLQLIADGTPLYLRRGAFQAPTNLFFIPPEYASSNCCMQCPIPPDGSCNGCDGGCPPPPPPPPQAIPINFTQESEANLNDGSLFFTYTWSSSSGNQSDLSSCTVGETIFYPGSGATYIWPFPMVQSTPNPTTINVTGNYSAATDTNGPPTRYAQPYSATNFQATQRFWWSCPYYNNGGVNNFESDIPITRKIFKDTDSFWKYQINKSGFTNTVKLPNQ